MRNKNHTAFNLSSFKLLSAFHLKIIAATAMLLDHSQVAFSDTLPIRFRVVGRLAFPLFAFLIAEGFRHTRSPEKFLARLAVFAVISEPFFDLVINNAGNWRGVDFLNGTNIFYTLLLGGAAITVYKAVCEHRDSIMLRFLMGFLSVLGFGVLAVFFTTDYSWTGVLFIFALYAIEKTPTRLPVMFGLCLFLWMPLLFIQTGPIHHAMVAATLLTVPLAALYNGKRGPGKPAYKWFFYAFYPAHLAVLAVLTVIF